MEELVGFTAPWEAFTRHNINRLIETSLARFTSVTDQAGDADICVRGYVYRVLDCPYSDQRGVSPVHDWVLRNQSRRHGRGGAPYFTRNLIDACTARIPVTALRGMAIANVQVALDAAARFFDSAVSALGASGNVTTESLAHRLGAQGFDTGVDLKRLVDVGDWLTGHYHVRATPGCRRNTRR